MDARQKAQFDALLRMAQFLKQHSGALGNVRYLPARNALIELVARLEFSAKYQHLMQVRASRNSAARAARRAELCRWHLQPIVAIARARFVDDPEAVRLRASKRSGGNERLVAHARAVARWAASHNTVFVDSGLPSDFLEQLRTATSAVEQAAVERLCVRIERNVATQELADHLTNATHLVQVVHALVLRQLVKKPELLAAWHVAKRRRPRATSSEAPDSCHRPVGRAGRGRSAHARPIHHPKEAA